MDISSSNVPLCQMLRHPASPASALAVGFLMGSACRLRQIDGDRRSL
jgi:hypothetical protein